MPSLRPSRPSLSVSVSPIAKGFSTRKMRHNFVRHCTTPMFRFNLLSLLGLALMLTLLLPALPAWAQTPTSISLSPVSPTISAGQTENFSALSGAGFKFSFGQANAITAGVGHTCDLLSDGTVQCWGLNAYGDLGNGTTTNSTSDPKWFRSLEA